MAKLRKVILSRSEVLAILAAFGATEIARRSGTSHRQFDVTIDGQRRKVTVDDAIDEFSPASFCTLWFIVTKQLQIKWERFYAADEKVARRANVKYQPPTR